MSAEEIEKKEGSGEAVRLPNVLDFPKFFSCACARMKEKDFNISSVAFALLSVWYSGTVSRDKVRDKFAELLAILKKKQPKIAELGEKDSISLHSYLKAVGKLDFALVFVAACVAFTRSQLAFTKNVEMAKRNEDAFVATMQLIREKLQVIEPSLSSFVFPSDHDPSLRGGLLESLANCKNFTHVVASIVVEKHKSFICAYFIFDAVSQLCFNYNIPQIYC